MSLAPENAELAARIAAWLSPRLEALFGAANDPLEVTSLETLAKGQSSHIIDVSCRRGDFLKDYIFRCEPRSGNIFLKPDILREAEVIRGVEKHRGPPVPHVWWTEADNSLLGAPFLVMTKVNGEAPLGKPSMHVEGLLPKKSPAQRELMSSTAMSGLVGVHALDWRATHQFLAPADLSRGYLGAYIDHLCEWYEWTVQGRSYPITDAALDYLRRESGGVDDSEPVLVWNDARVGNMLFAPDSTLAAIIDWEVPIIGPAGVDLGYWLMMDEFHSEAIGVERLPGWPDEAETIRRYETMSGRGIADIEYFVLLAAFFIATTLIRQGDVGVEQGKFPPDTRIGHDNTTTQMIARRLGLPVPDLCPDYAARRNLPLPQGKSHST